MHDIADLRKSYERAELDESAAAPDPLAQFERWFDEARNADVPEPNAMTLATVGADGRPSTRVVLVKGWDARGLVWYTNLDSRKGRELSVHPFAALQFHWVELERVVRIEGAVSLVEDALADTYYRSRPLASRIGAWASPQSRVIANRAVLEVATAAAVAVHGDDPPRPPFWSGYCLAPDRWEFWQGRRSRLHDRLAYRRGAEECDASGWIRERLAP